MKNPRDHMDEYIASKPQPVKKQRMCHCEYRHTSNEESAVLEAALVWKYADSHGELRAVKVLSDAVENMQRAGVSGKAVQP